MNNYCLSGQATALTFNNYVLLRHKFSLHFCNVRAHCVQLDTIVKWKLVCRSPRVSVRLICMVQATKKMLSEVEMKVILTSYQRLE